LAHSAIHAQNVDPDIAACNNVRDLNARVAGCSRLLARRIWPAKTEALIYLQRAQGYARLQQLERALQDYDATLRYDPKSLQAYSDRAVLYSQLGDPERAQPDIDHALRLNPTSSVSYAALGAALLLKGQSDAAIAAMTRSIALDPKQQHSYLARATAVATTPWRKRHSRQAPAARSRYRLDLLRRQTSAKVQPRAQARCSPS
jgi:tetratricopeptide (TPR) repeat protein